MTDTIPTPQQFENMVNSADRFGDRDVVSASSMRPLVQRYADLLADRERLRAALMELLGLVTHDSEIDIIRRALEAHP